MNTLLVTYDLNDEDDDRPPIVDEIKELALDYAQLSESSYAVLTLWTPGDVYPIVAKYSGICCNSSTSVQRCEGMTQLSLESCVTVH